MPTLLGSSCRSRLHRRRSQGMYLPASRGPLAFGQAGCQGCGLWIWLDWSASRGGRLPVAARWHSWFGTCVPRPHCWTWRWRASWRLNHGGQPLGAWQSGPLVTVVGVLHVGEDHTTGGLVALPPLVAVESPQIPAPEAGRLQLDRVGPGRVHGSQVGVGQFRLLIQESARTCREVARLAYYLANSLHHIIY